MIQEILNFIEKNNLYDHSMLDVITEYADKHNLDILEIAEEIKNDKTFKEIFYNDLVKNGEIYFLENGRMHRPKKETEIW